MFSERRVLNLGKIGIPDVPVVGRYEYSSVHPGLSTHAHPDTIEIVYLYRGRPTYRVGGRRYALRGGELFLTRPGEPHDRGGEPEERGVVYWLNLVVEPRQAEWLLLRPQESDPLKKTTACDSESEAHRQLGAEDADGRDLRPARSIERAARAAGGCFHTRPRIPWHLPNIGFDGQNPLPEMVHRVPALEMQRGTGVVRKPKRETPVSPSPSR